MSQTIITLRGGAAGAPLLSERIATVAIMPGMLVAELNGTVAPQATADGAAQSLYAQKNLGIAGGVDTPYAIGETVSYGAYHAGQEVSAIVAAGATAITDGAALESAGDGTLRVNATGVIVAWATEALDNSGSAETARLNIRVA